MIAVAFSLVMLSALLHALWNYTTKKVSGNLSVLYVGLIFVCGIFSPVLLLFPRSDIFVIPAFPFVLATGMIHAFYFYLLSKAYAYGNISTVYPIARGCGVVGTAIVAALLLREAISFIGIAGILATSVGILLIGVRRTEHVDYGRGLFFALLVGATIVLYYIVDKLAVRLISPVVYIYYIFLLSMLFLTPYMFFCRRKELAFALRKLKKYCLVIAVGAASGYLIILYVFQMTQVSYVVAVREVSVAIGALLGVKFLHEPFSVGKLVGVVLIVFGLVMIKIA